MKLVLDTGVLISALIRESSSHREILLLPILDFLLPEYALEEITRHKKKIAAFSGINNTEVDIALALLMERVNIVPSAIIRPHLKKAAGLIGHRDSKDIPFVALALAIENDGLWTNDKDFGEIKGIRIWSTGSLLSFLSSIE